MNASYDNFLIVFGMFIITRDKFSTNEYSSISSRLEEEDMLTVFKFRQPEKVNDLIVLTFGGMLIDVIDDSENA